MATEKQKNKVNELSNKLIRLLSIQQHGDDTSTVRHEIKVTSNALSLHAEKLFGKNLIGKNDYDRIYTLLLHVKDERFLKNVEAIRIK